MLYNCKPSDQGQELFYTCFVGFLSFIENADHKSKIDDALIKSTSPLCIRNMKILYFVIFLPF